MDSTFQPKSISHSHVIRRNQGKERTRWAGEIVIPEIEELKLFVSKHVFENENNKHSWRQKDTCKISCGQVYPAGVSSLVNFKAVCIAYYQIQQLTTRRKELFKQCRCSPLPSIIIPP